MLWKIWGGDWKGLTKSLEGFITLGPEFRKRPFRLSNDWFLDTGYYIRGMPVDIELVRGHYSRMHDDQLMRIAKYEMESLDAEVRPVVWDEVEKRGLTDEVLGVVQALQVPLGPAETEELVDRIRKLACPECGRSGLGLTAGWIRVVRSYVFITQNDRYTLIACQECLRSAQKRQFRLNVLLGWWGFPMGVVRTPMAIAGHYEDQNRPERADREIMAEFVIQNVGEIRAHLDDEPWLVEHIQFENRRS